MKSLKSFDIHLDELKKKPEFAAGFEEEKKRLGIALKIAEFRQNQKLTQAELAKRSGITQQQLSKLENGENCNISTFLKVCNSLDLEIAIIPGPLTSS